MFTGGVTQAINGTMNKTVPPGCFTKHFNAIIAIEWVRIARRLDGTWQVDVSRCGEDLFAKPVELGARGSNFN